FFLCYFLLCSFFFFWVYRFLRFFFSSRFFLSLIMVLPLPRSLHLLWEKGQVKSLLLLLSNQRASDGFILFSTVMVFVGLALWPLQFLLFLFFGVFRGKRAGRSFSLGHSFTGHK